jgi:hypothetical protein
MCLYIKCIWALGFLLNLFLRILVGVRFIFNKIPEAQSKPPPTEVISTALKVLDLVGMMLLSNPPGLPCFFWLSNTAESVRLEQLSRHWSTHRGRCYIRHPSGVGAPTGRWAILLFPMMKKPRHQFGHFNTILFV